MKRTWKHSWLAIVAASLSSAGCGQYNDGAEGDYADILESDVTACKNTLAGGETLKTGQYRCAANGNYRFGVNSNGNLELLQGSTRLWSAATSGSGNTATMQRDGNLVVRRSNGNSLWSSRTAEKTGAVLTVQNDGKAVIYHKGSAVWSVGGGAAGGSGDDSGNAGGGSGDPDNPLAANKSRGEWTLVIIPDTQGYAEDWTPNYPYSYMQTAFKWLASNAATMNIKLVQSVGDMVEANNNTEWNRVKESYGHLSRSNVDFAPCQGNHDGASNLNNAFPVSQFKGKPGWGGSYGGMYNSYRSMQIGAEKYLFITVQWAPNQQVLDWVKGILIDNPSSKAIIASHFIYSPKKGSSSTLYSQIVSKYPQVVLTNSGHLCTREEHSTSNNGKTHNFLTDYQCDTPGTFNIRIYKFKPLEDKVLYYTYSPVKKRFENDASSQGSFGLVQK